MDSVQEPDRMAIAALVEAYVDALHTSDADALERLFHPDGHLYAAPDGAYAALPLAGYLERVRGRAAPSSQGFDRYGETLLTDISSPTTAMVKVACAVGAMRFVDYLSLVKVDGAWRIIAKIYHRTV